MDRLNRHAVQATIARDSSIAGWPYEKPYSTAVRWQFEGVVHNDEWRSSDWRKAGEVQSIWIDADGNRVVALITEKDAAIQAIPSG